MGGFLSYFFIYSIQNYFPRNNTAKFVVLKLVFLSPQKQNPNLIEMD